MSAGGGTLGAGPSAAPESGAGAARTPPTDPAAAIVAALRSHGVSGIGRIRFKENRTRLLAVSRDGRTLHIHVAFRDAPAEVLGAVAAFLSARRGTRRSAEAVARIRDWARGRVPAAVGAEPGRPRAEPRPGPCCATPAQRRFLAEQYARLNADRFGGRLPSDLPLRLSRRMTRRLGHVRWHRREDGTRVVVELALNPDLMLDGNEAQLRDTLLHEMAHVEAWLEHGHPGHGAPWKRIARRVGCEPRACTRAVLRRRRRGAPPPTRVPTGAGAGAPVPA
ncbi:MAG TPA: SprT family zinc-dependent metalloprotease [Longimicrobiales bacterium]